VPVFVDTNVLVYARDTSDPTKHTHASEWIAHLWQTGEGRLSIQVLHEYYMTTTRKLRPGLQPADAVSVPRSGGLSGWTSGVEIPVT